MTAESDFWMTADEIRIRDLRRALREIAFTDCDDCYKHIAYAALGGAYGEDGKFADSSEDLE